jgi:hypothetical protein
MQAVFLEELHKVSIAGAERWRWLNMAASIGGEWVMRADNMKHSARPFRSKEEVRYS